MGKRRNQLSIFLIAVLMMMTVYYINTNDQPTQDVNGDVTTDITTDEHDVSLEFAQLRIDLKAQRDELFSEMQDIISDDESTIEEKSLALETMNLINSTTEKELVLESLITNIGYEDAFVHILDDNVTVTVLADEHTLSAANEIILLTKTNVGTLHNVTLYFRNSSSS